jgi:prepilin-type N-terminal cleavage/methylation domain-containing protein
MNKNNKAFSLIELSIVILVIGILVVGVTKGSRLMSEAKLKSAQALTSSSPVNAMTGVVLWLDATDASTIATGAIATSTYGDPNDGSFVAKWKDHNPQLVNSSKQELAALADLNRPVYTKNGINGLPTVSFDSASSDYLKSSNSAIASGKTSYTMVAVWQTNSLSTGMIFAQGGCSIGANEGSAAGMYSKNDGIIASWGCGANSDLGSGSNKYSAKNPNIAIAQVNKSLTNHMSLYLNSTTPASGAPATVANLISAPIFVGTESGTSNFFNGYISELIVFDRSLTVSEIADVMGYLSKKYSIKLK